MKAIVLNRGNSRLSGSMLSNWIEDMASSKGFVPMVVTLLSVMIGFYMKRLSRNARSPKNIWNDLAVAPDLMVAAMILFVTRLPSGTLTRWADIIGVMILVVSMFLVCTIVGNWGWRDENSLKPLIGVIIPDIIGIVFLFICSY